MQSWTTVAARPPRASQSTARARNIANQSSARRWKREEVPVPPSFFDVFLERRIYDGGDLLCTFMITGSRSDGKIALVSPDSDKLMITQCLAAGDPLDLAINFPPQSDLQLHVYVDRIDVARFFTEDSRRVAVPMLARLVLGSRDACERVVVGKAASATHPLREEWRGEGYDVHNDEAQAMHDLRVTIAAHRNQDRCLALVTADDPKGLSSQPKFFDAVKDALNAGWRVELWSWQASLSNKYESLKNMKQYKEKLKINLLDDFRELILEDHDEKQVDTKAPAHPLRTKNQASSRTYSEALLTEKQSFPALTAASSAPSTIESREDTWVKREIPVSSEFLEVFAANLTFLGNTFNAVIENACPLDPLNPLVVIHARDEDQLAIAELRLLDMVEDPRTFSQDLQCHATENIHIFADNFDAFRFSRVHVSEPKNTRIKIASLVRFVEGDRRTHERVVYANESWEKNSIWAHWQQAGYEVWIQKNIKEAIIRRIQEVLRSKQHAEELHTLVLVSGDAPSQNNVNNRTKALPWFYNCVEAALRCGWKVELWSWRAGLALLNGESYRKLRAIGLCVRFLDDFRQFITCPANTISAGKTKAIQTKIVKVIAEDSEIEEEEYEEDEENEEDMFCPITQDIFRNPCATPAGHIFEEDAIIEWLQLHGSCPMTRQVMSTKDLAPVSHEFRQRLDKYKRTAKK